MANYDSLTKNQKIQATLHRDVRAICTETCHFLGLEITKPAMEIIAELVHKKLSVYGADLEAFAKHAKRSTINAEDVKLLVRRNPSLKAHLSTITPAPSSVVKEKRRKTVATPVVRPMDTPAKPKEPEKEDVAKTNKTDEVEDMAIDGTIDLTFD
ncbi:centromere protein S-like [Ostrinia nubilalis]|uniref:centromere protein S-like n=1 Tax=Ostrinia nubilalis TaxID=29057 RepID=UPI003082404C